MQEYIQFIATRHPVGLLCLAGFWLCLISGGVLGVTRGLQTGKRIISIAWAFYAIIPLTTTLGLVGALNARLGDLDAGWFVLYKLVHQLGSHYWCGHTVALGASLLTFGIILIPKRNQRETIVHVPVLMILAILFSTSALWYMNAPKLIEAYEIQLKRQLQSSTPYRY